MTVPDTDPEGTLHAPGRAEPATSAVRPGLHFMLAHPAHLVAQGFGSGLAHVMPGTFGTLFGWASFALLTKLWPGIFGAQAWTLLIVAGFALGTWVCGKTGRDLGVADHGSMVWDEIVAFWLVLLFVPPDDLAQQGLAFVAFRFFDVAKPAPIRDFERRFKGGFGVMWDDVVAAFYALLALALWRVLWNPVNVG